MSSDEESLPEQTEPPPIGMNGSNDDRMTEDDGEVGGGAAYPSTVVDPSSSSSKAWVNNLVFRTVRPTDIPACYALEKASYPPDEAASKSKLQYRQHHAARYFRCAVISGGGPDEPEPNPTPIVGFVCATRCRAFRAESMSMHVPDGDLLAIHSVVVDEPYRRLGVATAMMKDYVASVVDDTLTKIVLLAKKHMLSFYVDCGFAVKRPSPISHGQDVWYELELDLRNQNKSPDGVPCYVVDAFAGDEMAGNPAAVVVLEEDRDSLWMQRVALEFNLSETAFLWPRDSSSEDELHYSIRYFTPTTEVPLCGHATLASAAILFDTVYCKHRADATIVFTTTEGIELRANMAGGVAAAPPSASLTTTSRKSGQRITMKFPTKPAVEIPNRTWVEEMMQSALHIPPDAILFAGLSEIGDVLVELTPEAFLAVPYDGLNYDAMLRYDGYTRGIILCCLDTSKDDGSDDESYASSTKHTTPDFLSRFFGPKAGIDEDPVTGSAHCVLAPFFGTKLGREKVIGLQTSRRRGLVECCLDDNSVQLTGTAITTMSGTLWL